MWCTYAYILNKIGGQAEKNEKNEKKKKTHEIENIYYSRTNFRSVKI